MSGSTTTAIKGDDAAMHKAFPNTFHSPIIHFECDKAGASATASAAEVPASELKRVAQLAEKPVIGVVFCGRQSPGGHAVVAAIADLATRAGGRCLGFVRGTHGLFAGEYIEVTEALLSRYRNQGGYHLLGRSADKLRTPEEQARTMEVCNALELTGLVLIGGTHTNSDAAQLAEFLSANQTGSVTTAVVGVPVSIDNDLHNHFVETTLGFDSATRTYAQLVGNTCSDAASARKYWFFVRLMGRNMSHVTLEVGLQTKPDVVLLGEEISRRKMGLRDVVAEVADVVSARAVDGKNFGVVLVPEGLIAYIPELQALISEINEAMKDESSGVSDAEGIAASLTPWSRAQLSFLPKQIQAQLMLEREVHGTVQLSQISSEEMLGQLVGDELARRKAAGKFTGSYGLQTAFFGYQSRSSLPSVFDCDYGYCLGLTAATLACRGCTGYTACVRGLAGDPSAWRPLGVPTTAMMEVQVTAKGSSAVVPSEKVDVHAGPAKALRANKDTWAMEEHYENPGPIQFEGAVAADTRTATLRTERHDYLERIGSLTATLTAIREACRPGVSDSMLDAALTGIKSLEQMLAIMQERE
jgi:pyrophosphate--fructose-6-phosphate 1-phosphotransferase